MSEDIDAFRLDLYLITRTYFVIKREQTFSFFYIWLPVLTL